MIRSDPDSESMSPRVFPYAPNNIIQNLINNIIEKVNNETINTDNNTSNLNETLKTHKKLTLKTTAHVIISILSIYKRQKQIVPIANIAHTAIQTNTSVDSNNKLNMDALGNLKT